MGRARSCCEHHNVRRGAWTPEEDKKLVSFIQRNHGHGRWRTLPNLAGLQRCGKSCRLRWKNYLRPDIKRGDFSAEEDKAIVYMQILLGNKWSAIAAQLPGRTDNEIKNYWHTHLKKQWSGMDWSAMGNDPGPHLPKVSNPYNHQDTVVDGYEASNLVTGHDQLLNVFGVSSCMSKPLNPIYNYSDLYPTSLQDIFIFDQKRPDQSASSLMTSPSSCVCSSDFSTITNVSLFPKTHFQADYNHEHALNCNSQSQSNSIVESFFLTADGCNMLGELDQLSQNALHAASPQAPTNLLMGANLLCSSSVPKP